MTTRPLPTLGSLHASRSMVTRVILAGHIGPPRGRPLWLAGVTLSIAVLLLLVLRSIHG